MRVWMFGGLLAMASAGAWGQGLAVDSDHDGLTDVEEQALLEQFAPRFMISRDDCAGQPAEFVVSVEKPLVASENGTIYGQAFPRAAHPEQVELHYYDLWAKDCGEKGHNLDAEHASALLERDLAGNWRARYWYAAAHEDTLCDASQMARAVALGAESHGPEVWISGGKHAAFLNRSICSRGCGADACVGSGALEAFHVVNLGEIGAPMNGATWASSAGWPLAKKMRRSDFSDARTGRLDHSPAQEIAWANPGKRPAQAAILGGDAALGGAATGLHATDSALTTADTNTSGALDIAQRKTGNALAKSYRGVKKALKAATGNNDTKSKK